jgi:AMMECR1 domain-containing protein
MGRSVLLQLARDSIEEVLQAKRSINEAALVCSYPLLSEPVRTTIKIFVHDTLHGSYASEANMTLAKAIIIGAKKAAFENCTSTPLTSSQYLDCEIEISLETPEGILKEKDAPLLPQD